MARILFTVTNDLSYDQRMRRIAGSLASAGHQVLLVGRQLRASKTLIPEKFEQHRLSCFFHKGFLFYAEFNLRLFLFLLRSRADMLCAIDLDTILPVLFVSRLKGLRRVFDAHELFTEMKEVVTRPLVQRFWLRVEQYAVPQFTAGYTVNAQLAAVYKHRHQVDYRVIRNLPALRPLLPKTRNEKFIIYQGAVNEGRCFETLIPAMQQVNAHLLVYGDGNFFMQAKAMAAAHQLTDKIIFKGPVSPDELASLTQQAYIGLTLFEATGMNQYYSLANRFFDYIMAGVPQVCVNYSAYLDLNQKYQVALLIADTLPGTIAAALNQLLEDVVLYEQLHQHCVLARQELNWQNEEKQLLEFYQSL